MGEEKRRGEKGGEERREVEENPFGCFVCASIRGQFESRLESRLCRASFPLMRMLLFCSTLTLAVAVAAFASIGPQYFS